MDITQIDTFFQRHRIFAIITLILIAGVIPFAGGFVVNHFYPGWEWDYVAFHSFLEGFGSLMSITIAAFILARIDEGNRNYMLPLACAMLAMGILDGFHACVDPGPEFVWLHSSAKFAGGFFLAMLWLPERFIRKLTARRLPKLLVIAFVVIGAISIRYPEILPEVLTDDRFTRTAIILNVIGGVSFLAGGIYFVRRFYRSGDVILLLFSSLCLLFGVAGVTFESSVLWDTGWWMWHLMRLAACIVALGYVAASSVSEYRRIIRAERIAKVANQQLVASERQLKATSQTLRESEQRFQNLVETSSDWIWQIDLEGKHTYSNNVVEEKLGYSTDMLLKMDPIELVHPEDREVFGETYKKAIQTKTGWDNIVLRWRSKDGKYRYFESSAAAKLDPDGELIGFIGVDRDITERRRTEEVLQENEIRYRELFDNMSSGVAVYEPVENGRDFVFKNLNQAGERINKVKKEDVVGKKVTEMFSGVEEFGLLDVFRKVYKTGKPQHHSVTPYKDDRISVWFDNYVYKLPSGEIVVVHDDITERKQAEEKLVIYQNNLRSLASRLTATEEEQRRQIASNLHDNINQALALSVNQLQKLRSSANLADSETLDSTRQIIEEVIKRVRNLTFDLGSPTLYKFGLKAAIFEFLDDRLRDQHEITCEFSGDDADKLLDNNVRVLLFQAVRELLINVIKHAKASRVEVVVGRKDDEIQICVSDDGVGFDTKITEAPMQRTGGFGLFNIQNQLDFIGGSFEMHSQLGSGSRFTLTAPLKTKTD